MPQSNTMKRKWAKKGNVCSMKIALVIKLHKICYQYIKKHRNKYIHCKNPTYSQPCTPPKILWSHMNHKKDQTRDHNSRGKVHSWVHIKNMIMKSTGNHQFIIWETTYGKRTAFPVIVSMVKSHIRLKGSKKKLHNVIVEKPCLQATFEYIDGRGSPDIKRQFVPNERCCVSKSAISVEHGVGVLVARRIE